MRIQWTPKYCFIEPLSSICKLGSDLVKHATRAFFSKVASIPPFRWIVTLFSKRDYRTEFAAIVAEDVPEAMVDSSLSQRMLSRNRYNSVFANEATRVTIESDEFFYFNANWVMGRSVIAAQGPLSTEWQEFWTMVKHHRVSTIVMLTDLSENGLDKCSGYWAKSFWNRSAPQQIAETTVYTNGSVNILRRSFRFKDGHEVVQYHVRGFLDGGSIQPETLAYLVKETATREGTILAHCSAGIGRTGTYCAALDVYRKQSSDVAAIVKDLRHPLKGRYKMVGTPWQYELICKTADLIVASPPSRVWSAAWRSIRAS